MWAIEPRKLLVYSATLLLAAVQFIPARAEFPEVGRDAFGDPLPPGVVLRLGTDRGRHPKATQLHFSAGGKTIVTAGQDNTVRIWDADTGRMLALRRLPFAFRPQSAWVSANGAVAAAMTKDGLECWDLASGKRTQILDIPANAKVTHGALSADGTMFGCAILRGRQNYSIVIRDLIADRTERLYLRGRTPRGLAFTPDGMRLVATFPDQNLVIAWDPTGGDEVWRVNQMAQRLNFSAGGRWLLLNGPARDHLALNAASLAPLLYDPQTGKQSDILITQAHDYDAIPFALAADGHTCAVASGSTVRVYRKEAAPLELSATATLMEFAPDGQSLVTVAGILQRWDISTGKPMWKDAAEWGHYSPVERLAWPADGRRIASASRYPGHTLRLWDSVTGKPLGAWEKPGVDWAAGELAFTTAGTPVSLLTNSWLIAANPVGGDLETPLFETEDLPPGAIDICLTADGRRAVILRPMPVGPTIGLISVDWESKHKSVLRDTRISIQEKRLLFPGGRILATSARQLDPQTGADMPTLDLSPGDPFQQCPLAASADGLLLAAGLRPKTDGKTWLPIEGVAVWERVSGQLVRVLKTGPAGRLAFAPDGRTLATAQPDGLHLWDVLTGREKLFRAGHANFDAWDDDTFAGCLAFSPDGRRLATGHADTTILVWDVAMPPSDDPSPINTEALWKDLASTDPAVGVAGMQRLAAGGEKFVAFLSQRLKPIQPPDATAVNKLITDLASPHFGQREAATQNLNDLGILVLPALREALKASPSREQRRRLVQLAGPPQTLPAPRGEDLRGVRAVQALERLDSAAARSLLQRLATGAADAWQTRTARAAVAARSPR
ncbi:MAG: WD40 repeat domain-containing protein [Gemmataceae bacterium]